MLARLRVLYQRTKRSTQVLAAPRPAKGREGYDDAFLVSTIDAPFETPINAHALADARLVAYRDRMRARFWA